jgi:hypothetical protein
MEVDFQDTNHGLGTILSRGHPLSPLAQQHPPAARVLAHPLVWSPTPPLALLHRRTLHSSTPLSGTPRSSTPPIGTPCSGSPLSNCCTPLYSVCRQGGRGFQKIWPKRVNSRLAATPLQASTPHSVDAGNGQAMTYGQQECPGRTRISAHQWAFGCGP